MPYAPPPRWPPDYSRFGCTVHGSSHESWAVISGDGRYRYLLARMWSARPLMTWVMLNPSTADGTEDDPTIRKCIGFAGRHGCGGILVVNTLAFRATKPADIPRDHATAQGPHNAEFIRLALQTAIGIAAWGGPWPRWLRGLMTAGIAEAKNARPLWCFGTTKGGAPRHPLMLAYETPLVLLADGRPFP
jgi:hypothetical protein